MRLPRSNSTALFAHLVPVIYITVFAIWLPLRASADQQQLTCSPSHLRFGAVTIGQTESQSIVLTNAGSTSLTIAAINNSTSGFNVSGLTLPATLAAGQSAVVNVTFAPTALGWTGETLAVASTASNSKLTIGIEGTGVGSEALTSASASLSFGQLAVGSSATLSVSLTNARAWKQTLTSFQAVGTGFSVTGPSLPLVLGSGQSFTVSVTFTPQAAGVVAGSLLVVSGTGFTIPLTGTGTTVGQLTLAPSTLSFGNVDTGSSATQSTSVSATGGSVTISSAASNNSQFAISGASFPFTLNAGQTANLSVVFSPSASGAASGTLTLISNASNAYATESLTGTGVAPQYSVNLSWNASTSSVAGYNVYRGTTAGAYSKISTALDPSTTYTDNTVVSGVTYYYAATAVNSSGEESGYSSPLKVSVP